MAALGIDGDDPHGDLIAGLYHVLDALDAVTRQQLRDVDEAAKAQKIDKGAVGDEAHHLAQGNGANTGQRALRGGIRRYWPAGREAERAPAAKLVARAAQGFSVGEVGASRRIGGLVLDLLAGD